MQGHIHKRVHSAADGRTSTTWYVVVDAGRRSDGRRRQKWHGGFRTRREAEAARAKLVNDINRGAYVAPTSTTLRDWFYDPWLVFAKTRLKASTLRSYQRNIELHVLPAIGDRTLSDITASMLNQLYANMLDDGRLDGGAGGLSARTVHYVHAIIRKVLADAIDAGLIAVNPASAAKPPRPRRSAAPTMNTWAAAELAEFLDHVKDHPLELAFHLLAYTGMRRGEVLGLRWDDVDLVAGRIAVRRTRIAIGYTVHDEAPKSHQARVIDLDTATVERLREHRNRHRVVGLDVDHGLVIAGHGGTPIHPDRLTKGFENAVDRSGLRRIRLHDLRHVHASLALQAGVPVKVISERLGHESPAFTLSQYAHVLPGMQAAAAQQIADLVRTSRE